MPDPQEIQLYADGHQVMVVNHCRPLSREEQLSLEASFLAATKRCVSRLLINVMIEMHTETVEGIQFSVSDKTGRIYILPCPIAPGICRFHLLELLIMTLVSALPMAPPIIMIEVNDGMECNFQPEKN
jgi:hypothetical protein